MTKNPNYFFFLHGEIPSEGQRPIKFQLKAKKHNLGLSFFSRDSINCTYLDVELQVLIHGIDMVKDVMCNPWNDAHELRVV